jgi:hypothetical protein
MGWSEVGKIVRTRVLEGGTGNAWNSENTEAASYATSAGAGVEVADFPQKE